MDYPPDEPIFAKPLQLEGNGETDASTCSTTPKPKYVPAEIRSLISKLGLRYVPSVRDDIDAHAARAVLLAEDLADAEPWKLQQAIAKWVATKPFMPKASELREIMAEIGRRPSDDEYLDVVTPANERLEREGKMIRWAWNDPRDRRLGTHLYSIAPMTSKLADLP